MRPDHNIPVKANRVLNFIILGMLLILIRAWYLTVIQHEDQLQQAHKPQRRSVIDRVERATIRDRFNIPLALNKIQYNASICYAQLRQIPSITWKPDENGKLIRFQERAAYISNLAKILSKELDLDPLSIEDLIYGKASLFPQTPFVIKEDISEQQYYRLKMIEKDWLAIHAEMSSKRFYPQGRVASDIIGYMGPISEREYRTIAQEMKDLQTYISERENGETPFLPKGFKSPLEVRNRLKELQEKAYTINDLVGKMGIESAYDAQLRGFYGKKNYEVDVRGNFLRELPGSRKAVSGQRILLSISSELQQFAESLLAQYEPSPGKGEAKDPWIRGGAIVAMQPKTGEILALASHPRFDPNDFIPARDPEQKKQKQSSVLRWLESEGYVAEMWNGARPFEHESFNDGSFQDAHYELNWERYLDAILSSRCAAKAAIEKIADIKTAVLLQEEMEHLLSLSGQSDMRLLIQVLYSGEGHIPTRLIASLEDKSSILERLYSDGTYSARKKLIDRYLSNVMHNDDKLLVLDLCRMAVIKDEFTPELINLVGKQTLSSYRSLCQAAASLQNNVKRQVQQLHHQIDFKEWREAHFKNYLKEKRKEEKAKKKYVRPYTEYLELLEKSMFQEFWQKNRLIFLETYILGNVRHQDPALERYLLSLVSANRELPAQDVSSLKNILAQLSPNLSISFLKSMRSYEELDRPLWGRYRHLRNKRGQQLEKHLAAAFYPLVGFGYGRSQAFRQSTPQGSIFKVVTAYEALIEKYNELSERRRTIDYLNPLTVIDDLKGSSKTNNSSQVLGFTVDGQPIKRLYKGGWLPRGHAGIGRLDLVGALEQSSNLYFALLASDHIQDPNNLVSAAHELGFGERTGIDLPGEIAGTLPDDVSHNRSGLYAFAIGQHSLVVTPLQTATMLATIANQGDLLKPKIVQVIAGKETVRDSDEVLAGLPFPFEENLSLVGIDFPLFSEIQNKEQRPYVYYPPTTSRRKVQLPSDIRNILLEGMQKVISGPKGTARANIIRSLIQNPKAMKDFIDLQNQIVGKTGTAEILFKNTLDMEKEAEMKTHIWFGAISFDPTQKQNDLWEEPELVVLVYLRFGVAGKDAAPLAVQMVKKWREICAKHGKSSYFNNDNP